ncbi:Cuticle protein 6 [Anthophora quadrimaculata]
MPDPGSRDRVSKYSVNACPSTIPLVPGGSQEYTTNRNMQTLIPFMLALGLAAGTPLNLLPYAYLSSSLPVYQQYQDTRTGAHAYSYAGGPSAKEEIKDADGVLRGSYSYIDANGILQSVFYVADDNGFRVAATNLPTDDNLNTEATHIILARNTDKQETSKISRRRRSVENSAENSNKDEKTPSARALYQPLLLSSGIPLATSHQSQVQVHNNARLDLSETKPVDLPQILPVQTIFGGLPLVARAPTYHENRIELHKDLGIEGPRPKDAVKIDQQPLTIVQTPSVASTLVAKEHLPVLPVLAKEALHILPAAELGVASTTTTISSHGVSQIHGPSNVAKEASSVALEKNGEIGQQIVPLVPIVKEAPKLATATVTTSISSHGISQIHGDSKVKIEPTLFLRAAPLAQLHSLVHLPVYLH